MDCSQIDRWFAIWQAVHPNSWMSNDQANLLPFRTSKNPDKFWNSQGSKGTQQFGYTYQDLVGSASQVENAFNTHYAWSVRTATHPTIGTPPADMTPLDVSHAQVFQYTSATTTDRAINFMAAAPALAQQPLKMAEKVAVSAPAAAKEFVPALKKEAPHPPADKHKAAKERAFKNLDGAKDSIKAPSTVMEAKVSRDWFVDDVVERYNTTSC